MKKKTLVAVPIFFLLATLTGFTQVAALPPALPPTQIPIDAPAALATVTEQAALVVEPGHVGQLSLRLNAGDKVDGRVTVVPEDINFIIEDPYGEIVLNAGRITEKDFSFRSRNPWHLSISCFR